MRPSSIGPRLANSNTKKGLTSDDEARIIQAIRDSTLGATKRIARRLHYSDSALYKMLEDENRPPLELVAQWTVAALQELPREKALSQIHYLVDRFLVPEDCSGLSPITRSIAGGAAEVMREVSEAALSALGASEDGAVSRAELEVFEAEYEEARRALECLHRQMQLRSGALQEVS